MSLNNREFLFGKERGRGYERERGRHIKIRFERVREVEGEAEIQRDRET